MSNPVILEMKGIVKSFGPVKALKGVDFDLRAGEVHALMGENGAGKSTLMKVLTGIHKPNEGTIHYNGKQVEYSKPKEAMDDGIVIVHQELNMMNDLTVAQNIFIGREEISQGLFIDDNAANKKAKELFNLLKLDINPQEKVGHLTVGKQQMVEIAKALSMDAKVIVFDEPTAALTESEINELFVIIDDLRQKGVGITYISHRMDEIARITDRVTVMRDGEYVGTVNTKDTTKDEIIAMMVGRTIYEDPKAASAVSEDAPVVLEVEHLNAGSSVKDVSFVLRKGEILGFSGLMGAGRTEVARLLFGADKKDSGTIKINGKEVDIKNPQDAIREGIGYLSEDRKRYGCIVDMTIANNTVMTNLDKYVHSFLINDSEIVTASDKFVKSLRTKTPSSKQLVRNLSGGNQQKVVIAKWLEQDSDILIFDEPTRGIDVGAKSEIYTLMNELVAQGKSIIMISSELTEILRMSDRIVVMCEGRKTGELDISQATQERILALATDR
ncbi:sugar ABC transporter ATP-binding protein [uncultured Granulicatella sp.]|uniref:sugar ABC transporter ATP-binding protein n=1 Tax=uncultured Granulicatella sp. TaxID=316089 RepID=UPI0028DC14ED|nr:sugar ABC transporter ATP-binding protein [uncultured Granulicatella sp.]